MCGWLGVSKSGFYEWRNNPGSAAARRREELRLIIQKAFDDSDSTYGYRRVHAQMLRWGVECGDELVRALMRELGLVPCQVRRRRSLTVQATAGPNPGPRRPRFHRRKTGRENGGRHHLHIHLGGMALPISYVESERGRHCRPKVVLTCEDSHVTRILWTATK